MRQKFAEQIANIDKNTLFKKVEVSNLKEEVLVEQDPEKILQMVFSSVDKYEDHIGFKFFLLIIKAITKGIDPTLMVGFIVTLRKAFYDSESVEMDEDEIREEIEIVEEIDVRQLLLALLDIEELDKDKVLELMALMGSILDGSIQ